MEFRLIHVGELYASSRTDTRASHKQDLRRKFHPQLRRLWKLNSNLRQYAVFNGTRSLGNVNNVLPTTEKEWIDLGFKAFGSKWERAGYNFVPLVTAEIAVRCSLDILLLRPEEDRFIFTQGDIDGQVKTLFDALRIPKNLDEAGGIGPQEDENPFFCFLEDDRLISEVKVTADQLLLLPNDREVKANTCTVLIHVKLSHKSPGTYDQWFA